MSICFRTRGVRTRPATWAEAARLYGEILREDPRYFEALAQLGAIQLENRR